MIYIRQGDLLCTECSKSSCAKMTSLKKKYGSVLLIAYARVEEEFKRLVLKSQLQDSIDIPFSFIQSAEHELTIQKRNMQNLRKLSLVGLSERLKELKMYITGMTVSGENINRIKVLSARILVLSQRYDISDDWCNTLETRLRHVRESPTCRRIQMIESALISCEKIYRPVLK